MTCAPIDWDGDTFCMTDGCHQPATHERLTGMAYSTPVIEMVCCQCAQERLDA